jgi:predicted O-methyltransferase YrrM
VTHPPSPAPLLELATAYQRSQLLAALLELEIPTRLARGARAADELAAELDAHPLAIGRLLDAGVALGVLVRDGDRIGNTREAQTYLVRGETYLGDLFHHRDRTSRTRSAAELAARLRAWRPGAAPGRPSTEAAPVGTELEGQHRLSLLVGCALARMADLGSHRLLLDLGGGTGAMSIALCSHFPRLHAVVIERADVVPEARARVRDSGLHARIEVREGDFVTEPLPEGGDVVLMANVLSMLDAGDVGALFARVFAALPAGGLVLLTGWMLDDTAAGPLLALLLCLDDIALDAPDVERPWSTYAGWLADAGFERIRVDVLEPPASGIVAAKPTA